MPLAVSTVILRGSHSQTRDLSMKSRGADLTPGSWAGKGTQEGGSRMLTLTKVGAGPGGGASKAAGRCPVAHHVLLWLEKDDVQLGCKEAAEHHRAAEADRHAHGGGLYL